MDFFRYFSLPAEALIALDKIYYCKDQFVNVRLHRDFISYVLSSKGIDYSSLKENMKRYIWTLNTQGVESPSLEGLVNLEFWTLGVGGRVKRKGGDLLCSERFKVGFVAPKGTESLEFNLIFLHNVHLQRFIYYYTKEGVTDNYRCDFWYKFAQHTDYFLYSSITSRTKTKDVQTSVFYDSIISHGKQRNKPKTKFWQIVISGNIGEFELTKLGFIVDEY